MTPEEIVRRVEKAKTAVSKRMFDPIPLGQVQKNGTVRFAPKGDAVWTSQVCLSLGAEHDLQRTFLQLVQDLSDQPGRFETSPATTIKGEWVGSRAPTQSHVPSLVTSEIERYKYLDAATTSSLIVLYLHGGGFITGSSSHSRQAFTARITQMTGGKCFSLDYPLAPQNMFPTALYNVLLAYLTLLYPPADACHAAIPARSIVFAGDSSGANLCFSIVQLIRRFRKDKTTVQFNGRNVELSMPAGIATIGAYVDQTDCMPSWKETSFDWLFASKHASTLHFVPDELWPPKLLRVSFYCHDRDLCHPLVSPMGAAEWTDAPPMWICVGEEKVADSCRIIAQRAAQQGIQVVWRQYSGVPHIWHLLPGLENIPQTLDCLRSFAHFCQVCTSTAPSPGVETLAMKDPQSGVQISNSQQLLDMSFEEVRKRMREGAHECGRSLVATNGRAPKL